MVYIIINIMVNINITYNIITQSFNKRGLFSYSLFFRIQLYLIHNNLISLATSS